MRIFSKFKDYYDGALSVFNDPSVVYDRKTRIESVVRTQELPRDICTGRNEGFGVFSSAETLFHVGFCGNGTIVTGNSFRETRTTPSMST